MPRDEQQYGFDGDGNIVVAHEYVSPGSFREELRVLPQRDCRGLSMVRKRSSVGGQHRAVFRGKDALPCHCVAAKGESLMHGSVMERYDYDGDLVSEIHSESALADRRRSAATPGDAHPGVL